METRLLLVLTINLAMVIGLVVVGVLSHSLGVLASATDYVGDAAGVGLSLAALRLSRRGRGHPRITSIAALANAAFLLLITTGVGIEAVQRLVAGPPHIHPRPVVAISVVAAVAMIGGALILGDIDAEDFNMRSVMLDTVADAAAAVGVAVSAAVILITGGLYWLDSAVALIVAAVIGYHAIKLLREVVVDLRPAT
jgi:cobalt-zinc-cadmium efflux system protein